MGINTADITTVVATCIAVGCSGAPVERKPYERTRAAKDSIADELTRACMPNLVVPGTNGLLRNPYPGAEFYSPDTRAYALGTIMVENETPPTPKDLESIEDKWEDKAYKKELAGRRDLQAFNACLNKEAARWTPERIRQLTRGRLGR